MSRDFDSFDKKECQKILLTFLKDERHIHKKKTIMFLLELRKISENNIAEALVLSEKYYFLLIEYFSQDKDQKLMFAASKIKEFDTSNHNCCLQFLGEDTVGSKLHHMLSIEHFLYKEDISLNLHKDVELITEYFKKTGNTNIRELKALHLLLHKNKEFYALVLQEKNKI